MGSILYVYNKVIFISYLSSEEIKRAVPCWIERYPLVPLIEGTLNHERSVWKVIHLVWGSAEHIWGFPQFILSRETDPGRWIIWKDLISSWFREELHRNNLPNCMCNDPRLLTRTTCTRNSDGSDLHNNLIHNAGIVNGKDFKQHREVRWIGGWWLTPAWLEDACKLQAQLRLALIQVRKPGESSERYWWFMGSGDRKARDGVVQSWVKILKCPDAYPTREDSGERTTSINGSKEQTTTEKGDQRRKTLVW
jgi:hypothetical protein